MYYQKIIDCIDSTLKPERLLKSGSTIVYKVKRVNSHYILKFAHLQPCDRISKLRLKHLKREVKALEIAKDIEGITHLVKNYGEIRNGDVECLAILKEYFEGRSTYEPITDAGLQKKLRNTVNALHSLGYVDFDIAEDNIIISPDKSDVRMIDMGYYYKFSSNNNVFFKSHAARDLKDLENLFIPNPKGLLRR